MTWQAFQGLNVPLYRHASVKRRYSVTADILSYQRCPRQYGYFAVRGYEPAHTVQIYYGTIIHQVLDRAHAHYRGLIDRSTAGLIPTDEDIKKYFAEVHRALMARGIIAVKSEVSEYALKRLQLFNRIEGPQLYPRVRDSEHRLQSDRQDYLLHGTVDVLADDPDWLPGVGAEIWDYKGGHRPTEEYRQDFHIYEFQMLVYAELYRERNGVYPTKAVLYFLGELDPDQDPTIRPDSAIIELPIKNQEGRIKEALESFDEAVRGIENCRSTNNWPAPPAAAPPDKKTCDICDIRWNCPTRAGHYPMRYP